MDILPYDDSMIGELVALFNRAVEPVPFCWPVDAERLAAAVAKVTGEAKSNKPLREKAAFVAVDPSTGSGQVGSGQARIVGFIDTAVGNPRDTDGSYPDAGVTRFLWYEPGRRAAGQALLETAESRFRTLGLSQAEAFPQEYRYECYHMHASYLSERLAHVAALLAFNGYRRTRGEVIFEWADFEPAEPPLVDLPVEIVVERKESAAQRPIIEVAAKLDSKVIGICQTESAAELNSCDAAQDWGVVHWLGVEREYRGHGLGKHLLSRALVELREAGYPHAAITTALDNHRAFVFYSNAGFRFADWTYGWRRSL
jgi:ribosomal protein S18 acetylase RimI-like enzyme